MEIGNIRDFAMVHMCLNIMVSVQPGTLAGFYVATRAQIALPGAKMIPAQIAEATKLAHEIKILGSMGGAQADPLVSS